MGGNYNQEEANIYRCYRWNLLNPEVDYIFECDPAIPTSGDTQSNYTWTCCPYHIIGKGQDHKDICLQHTGITNVNLKKKEMPQPHTIFCFCEPSLKQSTIKKIWKNKKTPAWEIVPNLFYCETLTFQLKKHTHTHLKSILHKLPIKINV